ncbi:hypothetical protein QBC36DRAFT_176325 [Triangularia setosa]|uniref:2EXR domain-containing protein n=1 Tax=Triangularia setosa TaxID=2587417 RepID=A0AAN6WFE9_9PEZI|nr:hypothetical protein QBC36DRAFT_176325 [Podospora setosa]
MEPSNVTITNQQQADIAHSSTNKFHYFFDLPPELREQIIEHVCLHPRGIYVRNDLNITTRGVPEPTSWELFHDPQTFNPYMTGPPVDLMLACAELYRVASEVYYGRNKFHVRLASPRRQLAVQHYHDKLVWGPEKVGRLLLGRCALQNAGGMGPTEGARLRLRHIVVRIERLGAHMEKELIPALGYMALNGRLRNLEVEVSLGNQNPRHLMPLPLMGFRLRPQDTRRTTELTGNPVMKALLVVLMDPDLEKASMKVRKTDNPSFWCQCHAPEVGWGEKSEDKPPMCFLKHLPGENCCKRRCDSFDKAYWAEVDIPKLVQACGIDSAQFRIKKVEAPDPFS